MFARRLYYGDRPVGSALPPIGAARAVTAEILDRLTEAEWQRKGSHNEHPSYGVLEWLEIYAEHCHEHADQITRGARQARRASPDGQTRPWTEVHVYRMPVATRLPDGPV